MYQISYLFGPIELAVVAY